MKYLGILFILIGCSAFSQDCELQSSTNVSEIKIIDYKDIYCLAKNANSDFTLFYIYTGWCAPCVKHLPHAIELAKEKNLDLYIILADGEFDRSTSSGFKKVRTVDPSAKILTFKDEIYGIKVRKRMAKFIAELTPANNEIIPDLSKYILVNKEGKVVAMTSYKDYVNEDWQDEERVVIKKKIMPVLNKETASTLN